MEMEHNIWVIVKPHKKNKNWKSFKQCMELKLENQISLSSFRISSVARLVRYLN